MARSFNGSAGATASVNLSAYNKITIGFWLNWTTFANDDALACEYSANYGGNNNAFICDPNSGNPSGKAYFGLHSTGGFVTTADFTRPSAGVWHHYLCLMDGTVAGIGCIPKVYVDGASVVVTNSNNSFTAISAFGNYNLYLMSRAASSLFATGSMADFAIWGGVQLTAGEALALGKGVRPYMIRSGSLVAFLPLDGLASPEPDYSGLAQSATLTAGTAFVPGPPTRMFTPRRPLYTPFTTVTFLPAWAQQSNLPVLGTGTY